MAPLTTNDFTAAHAARNLGDMTTDTSQHKDSKHRATTRTTPVVLIRHAQSQWNLENRFTGWADPGLTASGIAEARRAAHDLERHGYVFDRAYSSRLQRAVATRDLILDETGQAHVPRAEDWRLNERHYGALQGLDKTEATARVGEQQVWRWRRGYTDRAAPIVVTDPGHPCNDPAYADVDPARLPSVENLAETRERVVEFWEDTVIPRVRAGDRLLISAHGNTLRALIMALSGMSVDAVEAFEIPTATPIVYTLTPSGRALNWQYLAPGQDARHPA
jgi:2,3-bisphosphoglycerate-dependent phosphoglycerate mutase